MRACLRLQSGTQGLLHVFGVVALPVVLNQDPLPAHPSVSPRLNGPIGLAIGDRDLFAFLTIAGKWDRRGGRRPRQELRRHLLEADRDVPGG